MAGDAAAHFEEARELIVRACARGNLSESAVAVLSDSIIPHIDATLADLRDEQEPDFVHRLSEPLPGMLDTFAGPFGLRGELAKARGELVEGLAALTD